MEFQLKNPPMVEKRNLVKSGASIVITLPRKWIEENGLEVGSEVIVVANGDLQILKSNKENTERLNKKILEIRNQLSNQTQVSTSATDNPKIAIAEHNEE